MVRRKEGGLCASGVGLYCKGVSNSNPAEHLCQGFSLVCGGFGGLNMSYPEATVEPGREEAALAPSG